MPFTGFCGQRLARRRSSRTVIGDGRQDVAEDDRRAHVARAVGLHPGVLGEDVALHLLGEVLDHVVALGLAVDEHVEPDVLLEADHALDLARASGARRSAWSISPSRRLGARLADLGRLRVGADRGGGEQRQAEAGALGLAADLERALSRLASSSVSASTRSRTSGLRVRWELRRSSSARSLASSSAAIASRPSAEPARQRRDLPDLLLRERHPGAQLVVERVGPAGSASRSTGECSSEHEVETTSSLAAVARARSSRSRLCSSSLIQTLRPSTMPANSHLSSRPPSLGDQLDVLGPSPRPGPPRWKSSPTPSIGRSRSTP